MRIYLIRHAETVDNRANVYAGTTDSALTIHGNLQAERLAKYFGVSCIRFTYIFSSDLQRAYKTASAICQAQPKAGNQGEGLAVEVLSLAILREQDFGSYEGKPFNTRPRGSAASGKDDDKSQRHEDPAFKDVESKVSITKRANAFLNEHLLPILSKEAQNEHCAMAIVSHGIFLSYLWRSFLQLLPKHSLAISPELSGRFSGLTTLHHLGEWSNTGFLKMMLRDVENAAMEEHQSPSPASPCSSKESSKLELLKPCAPLDSLRNIQVIVEMVNGKDHLTGLKRTRGGVGSAKHDESQKTMESFFKKSKR